MFDFDEFSEILKELTEITKGKQPLLSMKEVAGCMAVSLQTAYGYRDGKTEPSWSSVVRLSRLLVKDYKYYRLAMQMTMAFGDGEVDGKVSDQLLNMYEAGAELHKAFKDRKKTEYLNALARMAEEIQILKKEGEAL